MADKGRILLVDDDSAFRNLCASWLRDLGHEVMEAGDPETALGQHQTALPDLVVLDLVMPPDHSVAAGMALIPRFSGVPVIVTTGHADRENALLAVEHGAWDFLGKPLDPDLLRIVIGRALEKNALEREVRQLRKRAHSDDEMGIIGNSEAIKNLRELIRRIAPTDISILILGPSGTGKELTARALHDGSPRRDRPFIAVHCGAIPAELLENELFGHVRGAFTGANQDRAGLIEAAAAGTLFLDEVGEMSPPMQVKLLRFLQEGCFRPVGGQTERSADVRVVCATHQNLEAMVQTGAFREDLYYRIKGVIVRTPGLNERIEDIPPLAQAFLNRLSGKKETFRLSSASLGWLMARPWHGHVRELQNLLRAAAALAPRVGTIITIEAQDLQFAHSGLPEPSTEPHSMDLSRQVAALEKRLILTALAETGNNQSQAAKVLGISRVGLWKKMKRMGVAKPEGSSLKINAK
ncbi:MAG: sigma-54-dependent Fis family transcriptional regulator [Magnetococcales bacterium]|nr:sigma-54-dependent Fis family transcriptional regulator [Magnetococcales bacterium]